MRITELNLKNFRRFKDFSISFDERLTVIAARNGQGKTTVLEGVVSALGPFVGSFDSSSSKHIQRSDSRYYRVGDNLENEQAFPVTISASSSRPSLRWSRSLNSIKSKTTIKEAKPLSEYGAQLSNELKNDLEVTLPVVCYYPSSRLWNTHRKTVGRQDLKKSRAAGYSDCLSSMSNFGQIEEWIRTATFASIQHSQQKGYGHAGTEQALRGIAQAVENVLQVEGWENFHFSISLNELAMFHNDHGIIPASLLSDGVRATVMLVADLALRCARLNSPFGERAPLETPGIVLIDEVDLHLHPAWQQRILSALMSTFPKVQFIVTTHSPQVVSTIDHEQIRVIMNQGSRVLDGEEFQAIIPVRQTQGVASSDVLAEVFAVDPVPEIRVVKQLSEYSALVQQGLEASPEAEELRGVLVKHFGRDNPVIEGLDRLARLRKMKDKRALQKDVSE